MYAHEYICFFTKYEYFMYFLVNRFFTQFFVGSSPIHILGFVGSMTGSVPITLVVTKVNIKEAVNQGFKYKFFTECPSLCNQRLAC